MEQRNTKALLSQIFGIVSAVLGLCGGGGLPFGIAAIILGTLAKKTDPENGQAKLGVILGIVGIVLSVIGTIIAIAIYSARFAAAVGSYM